MTYNWQQKDWPQFYYNLPDLQDMLFVFAERIGRIGGSLKALPKDLQTETIIDLMIDEAVKTSEIEGEFLSREDIRSSIRNNLGLNAVFQPIHDKRAEGIVELMLEVRERFSEPLSKKMLFLWHETLMQGHKGIRLVIGNWRQGEASMQIVSGPIGKYKVHFEAPPSSAVPHEMARFISWFNKTAPGQPEEIPAPVRAAIAHLYFESIHPFDDGNGRIGRAISEKALSQGLGRPILLSLSKTIEAHKKEYYSALKCAQTSNEITKWIAWFMGMILMAQADAEKLIDFILLKARFLERIKGQLNERQFKAIYSVLEQGKNNINARRYGAITGVSKATATRDLQSLAEKEILIPLGQGRNARYEINLKSE